MNFLAVFTDAQQLRAHVDDHQGTTKVENRLVELFRLARLRPVVILCIGTDRSTGDSLGPLVGTSLINRHLPRLHVVGTLDKPVHATNLAEHIQLIQSSFFNPFIVAIDASLGKLSSVGSITLCCGPLKPGAGVNKDLPEVGEVHLTGIVNVGGFMEYMVLQNTRLSLVWKMAERISAILAEAYLKSSNPR